MDEQRTIIISSECPRDEHGVPRDGHATVAYQRAAQETI